MTTAIASPPPTVPAATRPQPVAPPLRLTVIPADRRAEVLAQWRTLAADLRNESIMVSAEWVETWLDTFGPTLDHRFLRAERAGVTVGLALLVESTGRRAGPFPLRTLHLGTAGEWEADSVVVEYNTLLAAPADRPAFMRAIWEHVAAQSDWDEFHLEGFRAEELAAFDLPAHHRTSRRAPCFHNVFARTPPADELLEHLSSQSRRLIRRTMRQYEGYVVEWSETVEQAETYFADQIRLHQARWERAGEPGVYASPLFRQFHESLLRKLVPQGKLAFVRVRRGDEVIGVNQLLIDEGRGLLYQSGHQEHTSKTSPGVLVDWLTSEACRAHGLKAFDFMGGDTYHKRRLTLDCRELEWLVYQRPNLKNRLLNAARALKRFLKRLSERPAPTETTDADDAA